jgi:hypothetical protein
MEINHSYAMSMLQLLLIIKSFGLKTEMFPLCALLIARQHEEELIYALSIDKKKFNNIENRSPWLSNNQFGVNFSYIEFEDINKYKLRSDNFWSATFRFADDIPILCNSLEATKRKR